MIVVVHEMRQNKGRLIAVLESLLTLMKEYGHTYEHMGSDVQWGKHYNQVILMLDKVRNLTVPEVNK